MLKKGRHLILVPNIYCVTLVGRIGNNLEPKYVYDGKVVFRLGLAAKKKHKYGEEETDWFNLELWGRDVESQGIML